MANRDTSGAPNTRVPEAGEQAPDFTLPSSTGETIHLADLRGKQVVLYFYPKDDTPGCTTEACSFRDAWQEMEAAGIVVLGISRDSVKSHQKFANKYGLPFTLLSDEDGSVAQQYGVWVEKSMYGKKYMSTARTTFYIRPNGKIGHVWEQVKPEGHAEKVFEYLQKV
ncbi:MAG: thioredoxin-dependent thiol peroxidase [Ktedonobacterales bacterium]